LPKNSCQTFMLMKVWDSFNVSWEQLHFKLLTSHLNDISTLKGSQFHLSTY
jgi:hypothetical protein